MPKDFALFVIPATQQVYLDAMKAGYIQTFIEAAPLSAHRHAVLALAGLWAFWQIMNAVYLRTNRNFVGRMGHVTSEIYLQARP